MGSKRFHSHDHVLSDRRQRHSRTTDWIHSLELRNRGGSSSSSSGDAGCVRTAQSGAIDHAANLESDDEAQREHDEARLERLIAQCSSGNTAVSHYSGNDLRVRCAEYAALCHTNGAEMDHHDDAGPTSSGPQIVGRGGFSTVYRTLDRELGPNGVVAIKRLSPQRQSNERDYRRFLYEILALSSVQDIACCVRMVGFCVEKPYCCIIMEYMPRGSLHDVLCRREEALPWTIRMDIALDMALALADLHAKDLVHRDFKSMNVLLSEGYAVKLCDFSYLKECNRLGKNTVPHGTAFWMAPEVLRGEIYDKKSDVYSLGIVLWELLTRSRPYSGYDAIQVIELVGRTKKGSGSEKEDVFRMTIPHEAGALLEMDNTLSPDEINESQLRVLHGVIEKCWQEDWRSRPSSGDIVQQLLPLSCRRKSSAGVLR